MNFNKPMIDLVREIRRRAPAETKPSIKLTNPELLNELMPWYQSSRDTIVKTLIKELFHQAGEPWVDKLSAAENPVEKQPEEITCDNVRYITKVYRGHTQLMPSAEPAAAVQVSGNIITRIYRGQIVRS